MGGGRDEPLEGGVVGDLGEGEDAGEELVDLGFHLVQLDLEDFSGEVVDLRDSGEVLVDFDEMGSEI